MNTDHIKIIGEDKKIQEFFYDLVDNVKRQIVRDLQINGQCKLLSVASGKLDQCDCPKCQIDRMTPQNIVQQLAK